MADNIFYGTSGPIDADIAIVAESWGSDEQRQQKPLVGRSGQETDKLLALVGLDRRRVFCTNVVSERPPGNEMLWFFHATATAKKTHTAPLRGLYPKDNVLRGLDRLYKQLEVVKPKLVIGFGNYALWALTSDCFSVADTKGHKVPTGITKWRGSQLYTTTGTPFLPTYHPAAAMRKWAWWYNIKHDLQSRIPELPNWAGPQYNFIVHPSFAQTLQTLRMLRARLDANPTHISVDIETRTNHIACIGFAWSRLDAICIPLMCVDASVARPPNYWSEHEERVIVREMGKVLLHPNMRLIGQNFIYDAQYLAAFYGILVTPHFDTMVAQHLCWPGTPKGLHYISSLYCTYHRYWKDEGKEWHPKVPEEQLWVYNCKDAVVTWESANELRKVIGQLGLQEQFATQMAQIPMVMRMNLKGVRIDRKVRAEVSLELVTKVAEYERRFEKVLPQDVYPRKPKARPWYRSPKQQMEIFYEVLGAKPITHRKTKATTVNDAALETLYIREPLLRPILRMLQEYRSLNVFLSNFALAKLDFDGRMRCEFNITGTETFRWNSGHNAFGRGANMQAIPEGTKDA